MGLERIVRDTPDLVVRAVTEHATDRRVTADWLAGRLGIPRTDVVRALDHLVASGAVLRRDDHDGTVWFAPVSPGSDERLRRRLLQAAVLVAFGLAIGFGARVGPPYGLAIGLVLGLIPVVVCMDGGMRRGL